MASFLGLRDRKADIQFDGAPDLAVEVVSPMDALKDIREKVFEYLDLVRRVPSVRRRQLRGVNEPVQKIRAE